MRSAEAGAVEARARALIGVRFRLHGRDAEHGVDCVGLVALAIGRGDVPRGYALRGGSVARVAGELARLGLVPVDALHGGDVMLCASGPGQLHLGIVSGGGVIHADAGLRRVVERPGIAPWPLIGGWRLV